MLIYNNIMENKYVYKLNNSNLTKKEYRILDFLILNSERVRTMKDLIKETKVGYSTIYSLVSKLGEKSFSIMIRNIHSENVLRKSNRETFLYNKDSIFRNNLNLLEGNLILLKKQDIDKIVDKILKAKRIIVVGSGFSGLMADLFCDILLNLGIDALAATSRINRTLNFVRNATKDDLLICFSMTSTTLMVRKSISIANLRSIKSVLVTSNKNHALVPSITSLVYENFNGWYTNVGFSMSLWVQYVINKILKKTPPKK